jgi:hypothetical protein
MVTSSLNPPVNTASFFIFPLHGLKLLRRRQRETHLLAIIVGCNFCLVRRKYDSELITRCLFTRTNKSGPYELAWEEQL